MKTLTPASRLFRPSSARSAAFTIIELVVAMSIATIMMFLINQIFFQTTNAVSRGIGLSHIIGESRALSSTLQTDFIADQIVKPANGGFMFIGFKQYNNIDFPSPRRQGYTQAQITAGLNTQSVTSDQIMLALDIEDQSRTPLTPQNDDTFSPYAPSADKGLLWYGHVARLRPDGTDQGEINNSTRNRFGHQWIVGRQLMFLDDAVPGTVAHIQGPYARDPVTVYATIPAAVTPTRRWMALSDILNINLAFITDTTSGTSILSPTIPLTDIQYITHVARMAYVTERLRVAATVEPALVAANSFQSWNLAQTHPAFMSYCSDFEISFAGEFDNANNGIDLESSLSVVGGDVRNYAGGNIKWYGYPTNDPKDPDYTPGNPIYNPADPRYDPTKPAIYDPSSAPVINGGAPTDPIYVTNAALTAELTAQIGAVTAEVDSAIVFRNDILNYKSSNPTAVSVKNRWPQLIRMRYRLHDERGEIESTNGSTRAQGIWFEQIMRVQ